MYQRKNKREASIISQLTKQGYSVLTKGYPDITAYNETEVIFIEVKKKQKRKSAEMRLSLHQRKMHKIFKRLGLNIKVIYVE